MNITNIFNASVIPSAVTSIPVVDPNTLAVIIMAVSITFLVVNLLKTSFVKRWFGWDKLSKEDADMIAEGFYNEVNHVFAPSKTTVAVAVSSKDFLFSKSAKFPENLAKRADDVIGSYRASSERLDELLARYTQ